MQIKKWSFEIEGVSPGFLMNNPAAMTKTGGQEATRGKKIYDPFEDAAKTLYLKKDGTLYAPSIWFRMAILYAARGAKIGKVAAKNILAAALFMTNDSFDVLRDGKKIKHDRKNAAEEGCCWTIDTRRAVVQRAGIQRSRALIYSPWTVRGEFDYDAEIIKEPKILTEFLSIAGQICGIGDYAPRKSGWFGRFAVKN